MCLDTTTIYLNIHPFCFTANGPTTITLSVSLFNQHNEADYISFRSIIATKNTYTLPLPPPHINIREPRYCTRTTIQMWLHSWNNYPPQSKVGKPTTNKQHNITAQARILVYEVLAASKM